jgi:hypothetical protein
MPRKRRTSDSAAWMNLALLGAESQRVIWLRMMKLAGGGRHAEAETNLMVSEKVAAATDAGTKLLFGASPTALSKATARWCEPTFAACRNKPDIVDVAEHLGGPLVSHCNAAGATLELLEV